MAFDYDLWLSTVPEERSVASDWQGDDLYEGDRVYEINGQLVKEDDLKTFIESEYGEAKTLEEECIYD